MKQLGKLSDQVWSDHLELIHRYAPKGLDTISAVWFTPENAEHIYSSLEDWDRFLIDCLVHIDESLEKDDEDMQDEISGFLDEDIANIVHDWLDEEFQPFRIFPATEEDDDLFTGVQCTALVEALMRFAAEEAAAAADAPEPPVPTLTVSEIPVPDNLVPQIVEPSEPAVQPVPVVPEPPVVVQTPVQQPVPEVVAPPVAPPAVPPAVPPAPPSLPSMTAAIQHRRKTLCLRPRPATRGKTRKLERRL